MEDVDIPEDNTNAEEASIVRRRSKRIERNQRHVVHLEDDEDSEEQLNKRNFGKRRKHV